MTALAIRSDNADLILFYLRISADKAGDELGVKRQDDRGKQCATEIGATRILRFKEKDDKSASGKVLRPEFERLLDAIAAGQVDGATLYAWAQDRLARNAGDFERLIKLCELHSIRIICPADGTDVRPNLDGSLITRIRSAVAEEELRKLKARIAEQRGQARQMGKRMGKRPFGWNADGTAHPVQAAMVAEAVAAILSGVGTATIAADWNQRGLPRLSYTKRKVGGVKLAPEQQYEISNPWDHESVRRIVDRASNAGIYLHHGVRLDVSAAWEPLISEADHLAVLSTRAPRRARPDKQRHLLAGLLRCASCGGPCYGITNVKQSGRAYPEYQCEAGCSRARVSIARADLFVTELVVKRLATLRPADLVNADQARRTRELSSQIAAGEAMLSDTHARHVLSISDPANPMALDAKAHAELIGAIGASLTGARVELDRLLASSGNVAMLAQLIGPGAEAAWVEVDVEIKRAVLRRLVGLALIPSVARQREPISERIGVERLV